MSFSTSNVTYGSFIDEKNDYDFIDTDIPEESLAQRSIWMLQRANQHDIEKICTACLGVFPIPVYIQEQLFLEAQIALPEDLQQIIKLVYKDKEEPSKNLFFRLLGYAEWLKRDNFQAHGKIFEELATKLVLIPHLTKLSETQDLSVLQECINALEEIEETRVNFSQLLPQLIQPSYVYGFVKDILPKKTPPDVIRRQAEALYKQIEKTLKEHLFTEKIDFLLNLEKGKSQNIWLHKDPQGVYLICFGGVSCERNREDGLPELLAAEMFIPYGGFPFKDLVTVERAIIVCYAKKEERLNKELTNRAEILKLTGSEEYFLGIPIIHHPPAILKKAAGYKSLTNEFESIGGFLSISELLQVFEGVLGGLGFLKSVGAVCLAVHPDNIMFKREDQRIHGVIDSFEHLSLRGDVETSNDPRRNVLAQIGFASFETDQYALILLMAEAFFLDLTKAITLDEGDWEQNALDTLKNLVHFTHYDKVVELKKKHEVLVEVSEELVDVQTKLQGFQELFSRDLLDYVKELRGKGEESFECKILERFAFKMALFPEISALLSKALRANAAHQEILLDQVSSDKILASELKIPTLEEVFEVLQVCTKKLEDLWQVERELTNFQTITEGHLSPFIDLFFGRLNHDVRLNYSQILLWILTGFLNESPYVGSEIRIHKNSVWRNTTLSLPFSLWICIQKDKIVLEILQQEQLGMGSYKKVKAATQVEIFISGNYKLTPLPISRLQGDLKDLKAIVRGINIQQRILSLPGAEKYFLASLKKHAPYDVKGREKIECTSMRFNGTLRDSLVERSLLADGLVVHISNLEYISGLQNAWRGIKMMADQGISHRDICTGNMAFILEEGRPSLKIFDFDLAAPFGTIGCVGEYWSWNTIHSKYGFVSSERDIQGMVLMIAETLIRGFSGRYVTGENEEITAKLQNILKDMGREKTKLRTKHAEAMNNAFPHQVTQGMVQPLICPTRPGVTEAHNQLFINIGNFSKNFPKAILKLKHFAAESLYFDRVFDLLVKTLTADKKSEKDMIEYLKTLPVKQAALEALKGAGFPTLEEVESVLLYCEERARMVEKRCDREPSWCVVS